jgi:nucleolar GTP-binding protein
MYKIPTILTVDELLNKAFKKAGKIPENMKIRNRITRKKKFTQSKLDAITDILDSTLNKYITTFPSFDQVHKFEYELIDIVIGIDKIRKSLGAIDWARKQIRFRRTEIVKKLNQINSQKDFNKLEELRKAYYGRITSILNQISKELEFLGNTRNQLKKLPQIDPELFTIVVAGFPNVGKSLLVKQISSAKPMVATYPFTTTQLNLGHIMFDHQKLQVIDTPGLLDRSFEERNMIERQAIMALQYLANLIIFILDPSEHCGYTIDIQDNLLKEIRSSFKGIELIEIENKVDLNRTDSNRLKLSASTGLGIDQLLNEIQVQFEETQEPSS